MFIGLLKAYMKGIDQLNLMQKKLTLFDVPFWKHSGKSVKVVHFLWTVLLVDDFHCSFLYWGTLTRAIFEEKKGSHA